MLRFSFRLILAIWTILPFLSIGEIQHAHAERFCPNAPYEYWCEAEELCIPKEDACCPDGEKNCAGICIKADAICCNDPKLPFLCNGQCIPETAICLLQPPPGVDSSYIDTDHSNPDPFQYWQKYFGLTGSATLWSWGLWMGAGLAVLNVVVAGFQIMGGDSMGMVSDGKQRMLWSIVGLLMLMFAGVLLNFLNPLFFQAG